MQAQPKIKLTLKNFTGNIIIQPQAETKYNQGKIYKIVANGTDECYVGSTIRSLSSRWSNHLSGHKRWLTGVSWNCASYTFFEKHGTDNCHIELIELWPCKTLKELLTREDYWMQQFKTVNVYKGVRDLAVKYVDKKKGIKRPCPQCGKIMWPCNISRHKKRWHPEALV
jgi:hypothetical protein